jgi:hypothetical protein
MSVANPLGNPFEIHQKPLTNGSRIERLALNIGCLGNDAIKPSEKTPSDTTDAPAGHMNGARDAQDSDKRRSVFNPIGGQSNSLDTASGIINILNSTGSCLAATK